MKIITWNINGLRSISKKKTLDALVQNESPDVLCLQEIRCSDDIAAKLLTEHFKETYPYVYYNTANDVKKGYAGTAVLCKKEAIFVKRDLPEDPIKEGRVLAVVLDPKTVVLSVYAPNSQEHLKRLDVRLQWDMQFQQYLASLQVSYKNVFVCGDMNVAHKEIDIHNPSGNRKHAGFSLEERSSFDSLLSKTSLIDSFRFHHPTAVKYSWWSNFAKSRERNKGWRIDYILSSPKIKIELADILTDVTGSDHAPCVIITK